MGPAAAGADPTSHVAVLARAEQVIDLLRTRHVCEGWHGCGLDEEAASRTLDYFRRGMPDDDQEWEAAIHFVYDHGQSLDLPRCSKITARSPTLIELQRKAQQAA